MKKVYLFLGFLCLFIILFSLKNYLFPSYRADWISEIPISHRGLFDNEKGIPENSLLAFQKAIEKGYAIELDIHLTKDNRVVVHHDFTLKRLSHSERRLDELTLEQIQTYRLLGTQEFPPSLEQVFALVQGRVPIYVEIKRDVHGEAGDLEKELLTLLEHYEGRVALLSFNSKSLEWFSKNAPQIYRGQNYEPTEEDSGKKQHILKAILSDSWRARPHFFVYNNTEMPESLLKLFSFVRHLIPYNVKSLEDYKLISPHASNVIFEKIEF